MEFHDFYINRCLQLAKLGLGKTKTNPMVGAVLVHNNTIIGEGYHEQYGQAHAEVNCLKSVRTVNKELIPEATLYVSLEPCNHTGKTPPCSHAIVNAGIKKVIVGTMDINPLVAGSGIEYLKENGVEVEVGFMEAACHKLNKVFFTNQEEKRAFVKLKWAETANGYIGETGKQTLISNEYVNILNHKYRSQVDGVIVGFTTALIDSPQLTSRHWSGKQPARIFIDWNCELDPNFINLPRSRSIVLNLISDKQTKRLEYHKVEKSATAIAKKLLELGITSVLVEGGSRTHDFFIKENCWDEAVIICSNNILTGEGVPAARLPKGRSISKLQVSNNLIRQYSNSNFLK